MSNEMNEIIGEIHVLLDRLEALRVAEKRSNYVKVGKSNGRGKIVLNDSERVIFKRWLTGKISAVTCSEVLEINRTTLYSLKKRYPNG